MNPPSVATSPRLRRLVEEFRNRGASALGEFWRDAARGEGPLIEEIAGDPEHVLVTFLWRDAGGLRNVLVASGLFRDDPVASCMAHLEGTDVRHASVRAPKGLRTAYLFSLNDPLTEWTAMGFVEHQAAGNLRQDPLNPHVVLGDNEVFLKESVLTLPGAAPLTANVRGVGVPAGKVSEQKFASRVLQNERKVWEYVPPGYGADRGPYPWILFLDGGAYLDLGVPAILDNLLAAGRIPPTVAVFARNVRHATRHVENSCNPSFNTFLADELAPWVRGRLAVAQDPARVAICGESYTGLGAMFAGLRRYDVFGNVLAQSGAYFWHQGQDRAPDPGEDTREDWIIRQFAASPRLPLRFHVDAGLYETGMLDAARRMRAMLQSKGYPVDYVEFEGGHDFIGFLNPLPEAITYLANPPQG